jgi:hypothetical protein
MDDVLTLRNTRRLQCSMALKKNDVFFLEVSAQTVHVDKIQHAEKLDRSCSLPYIQYPRCALITPYMFLFYNNTQNRYTYLLDFVLINGSVQCRDSLVYVTRKISYELIFNMH